MSGILLSKYLFWDENIVQNKSMERERERERDLKKGCPHFNGRKPPHLCEIFLVFN